MIKCDAIWLEDGQFWAQAGETLYVYVGDKGHQQRDLDIESLHGWIGYHGWRRVEDT
jgi:hypothetical protein